MQGAGMDALSVLVTLLMFQLLSGWLKALAPANIAAHAHTRRGHGEMGFAERASEAEGAQLVSVTLLMSQAPMSGLHVALLANRFDMSEMARTFQLEIGP